MKKRDLISYGILFSFIIFAQQIILTDGFVPWGIVADDTSSIQPFITSKTTGKDYRIPQDQETLSVDSFWLYLEWRGTSTSRELILQLWEEKEREIIVGDQSTTEVYWEVYAETVVQMIKGSNEWNDPRFALKKIDNNILSEFKKSDVKEKIVILYRNLEIEFYHKTSFAEVEQTKTIQQWNMEAIILALWTIFLGFLSGGASKVILNKVTWVPDLPHWSIWLLIFLFIIISTILFFLIAGYNIDEIMRIVILIPAPIISIFFAFYFAFWLASKFRPAKLREFLFIILKIPTLEEVRTGKRQLRDEKELPVDAEIIEGYVNQDGEIELIHDPDSYWETVRRLKMGGIKFKMAKLGKRIRIKQTKKNFDDIIFCEKFEKQDLEVKVKDGALWSISSVVIILGICTWILPLMLNFASIIFSILGTLFLACGMLFFFWENVDITSPVVNVTPITDRDAVSIIRDKLSLDLKNLEIAELELDLYSEKADLSKKARAQTMKALELIENALMPLKELAEAEIELEDLPEPIKKAILKWKEDWSKEKGLSELKDFAKEEKGETE